MVAGFLVVSDLKSVIVKKEGGRQNTEPVDLEDETNEESTVVWFVSVELKQFWYSTQKAYCHLQFPIHIWFFGCFCEI